MGAKGRLIRRFKRRQRVALSALALIVALGGSGAFVAAVPPTAVRAPTAGTSGAPT
jgi:uncharacterized protein involved in exopolysaccharide biosynthesis